MRSVLVCLMSFELTSTPLQSKPKLWVVSSCVVKGGRSAGNDLKAIQSGEKPPIAHFQAETLDAIERLPQPVIAAVQGHCYTGALELAIACDLLIAADSARFAIPW